MMYFLEPNTADGHGGGQDCTDGWQWLSTPPRLRQPRCRRRPEAERRPVPARPVVCPPPRQESASDWALTAAGAAAGPRGPAGAVVDRPGLHRRGAAAGPRGPGRRGLARARVLASRVRDSRGPRRRGRGRPGAPARARLQLRALARWPRAPPRA